SAASRAAEIFPFLASLIKRAATASAFVVGWIFRLGSASSSALYASDNFLLFGLPPGLPLCPGLKRVSKPTELFLAKDFPRGFALPLRCGVAIVLRVFVILLLTHKPQDSFELVSARLSES